MPLLCIRLQQTQKEPSSGIPSGPRLLFCSSALLRPFLLSLAARVLALYFGLYTFLFLGFSFSPSTPPSLWLTHASPRLPPSELGKHLWNGTTNRSHRKKALEKGHSLQQLHRCGCLSFPPGKGRHYTEIGRLTFHLPGQVNPPMWASTSFLQPTLSLPSLITQHPP